MPFTDSPLEVGPERGQGSASPPGNSTDARCGELGDPEETVEDDILPPL